MMNATATNNANNGTNISLYFMDHGNGVKNIIAGPTAICIRKTRAISRPPSGIVMLIICH
jgi:hypothetical protein